MSRILDRELGALAAEVVRPRLPSLFEPGLLQFRAIPGGGADESVLPPDVQAQQWSDESEARPWTGQAARTGSAPPTVLRPDRASDAVPSTSGETGSGAGPARAVGRGRIPSRNVRPVADEAVPGEALSDEAVPDETGSGAARHRVASRRPVPTDLEFPQDQVGHRLQVEPAAPAARGAGQTVPAPPAPPAAAPRPANLHPHGGDAPAEQPVGRAVTPGLASPPVVSAPVVRITIGRVEVRSGSPDRPPAAPPRPAVRSTPRLGLSEYLDQREEGPRR